MKIITNKIMAKKYSRSSHSKRKNSKKNNTRRRNGWPKKSHRGGGTCVKVHNSVVGAAAANIHNTNPQASLDLDNVFNAYGGPVPLGQNIVMGGGASKCMDDGVGTASPKSETFKQYMENMSSSLNVKSGGGYSSDPSEMISGQPVYKGYDDCCPPAVIGNALVYGSTPDKPVCGKGAMAGGSRKKSKKSKKTKKSKNNNRKTKKNNQRGGAIKSRPADFDTVFNTEKSRTEWPMDVCSRKFGARQPFWGADEL